MADLLADHRFEIQELVAKKRIYANMSPFLSKQKQMPAADVRKTRRIAELHIHVEAGQRQRDQDFEQSIPPLSC